MKIEIVYAPENKRSYATIEFSDYKEALLYITYNSPIKIIAIRIANN